MTQKLNSRGFSFLALLLIIGVVTAIGLSGWYVWHKNSKTEPVKSPSTVAQTNDKKTIPQTDPSEGGKYLVISEWGVRVPLPESLRGDVTYGLQTRTAEGTEVASFEVGKLAQLPDSNCKLHNESDGSGKSGGIGVMLIRGSTDLPPPEGVGTSILTSSDNQYRYYATHMKALCIASKDYEQIQLEKGAALSAALKQLQQTPQ